MNRTAVLCAVAFVGILSVGAGGGASPGAAPGGSEGRGDRGAEARLLVVNKSGHSLSVFDVSTGEEVARVPTGHSPHEVALSPDGDRAYVTDYGSAARPGNTVTVVDVERGEPVHTLSLGRHTRPHGIDVARDGTLWVTT